MELALYNVPKISKESADFLTCAGNLLLSNSSHNSFDEPRVRGDCPMLAKTWYMGNRKDKRIFILL